MDEIELGGALIDPLEHDHMQRIGIADRTIEPQCTRPYRVELRRCHRAAAGKQRYLMAERNQPLRQPRNDPLGPAIKLGRDRFRQRRDLGDMHQI